MLFLKLALGQKIIIQCSDGEIEVVLAGMESGGKAKIGVQAPPRVLVDREEIHRKKQERDKR